MDARAAHDRAKAAGWTCSYHTIYRARRQLLEQDAPQQPLDGGDVLAATALANPILTHPPARGRFTL